jgi:LysM repeat protein
VAAWRAIMAQCEEMPTPPELDDQDPHKSLEIEVHDSLYKKEEEIPSVAKILLRSEKKEENSDKFPCILTTSPSPSILHPNSIVEMGATTSDQIDKISSLSPKPQERKEMEQKTSYIVEEGDTLIRISMKLNISVARLKKYNHLFGKNEVMVGQVRSPPPSP